MIGFSRNKYCLTSSYWKHTVSSNRHSSFPVEPVLTGACMAALASEDPLLTDTGITWFKSVSCKSFDYIELKSRFSRKSLLAETFRTCTCTKYWLSVNSTFVYVSNGLSASNLNFW